MQLFSRVAGIAVDLPEGRQTSTAIEEHLRMLNPGLHVPRGLLEQMYGMRERRIAALRDAPTDLASRAGKTLLEAEGLDPLAIDLLIFTGISSDLLEPANAHVVAQKMGLDCPVFDLRNACNGFIDAMGVADALIRSGRHDRALVVTGEVASRTSRWHYPDPSALTTGLASLTLSDIGAAALLEVCDEPGIIACTSISNSRGWQAATLYDGSGNLGPAWKVEIDSQALAESFAPLVPAGRKWFEEQGLAPDDLDLVAVHQPSEPFVTMVCDLVGLPHDKIVPVFSWAGNVSTGALPLQLHLARESSSLVRGDLVGLFGLASGASAAGMLLRW